MEESVTRIDILRVFSCWMKGGVWGYFGECVWLEFLCECFALISFGFEFVAVECLNKIIVNKNVGFSYI